MSFLFHIEAHLIDILEIQKSHIKMSWKLRVNHYLILNMCDEVYITEKHEKNHNSKRQLGMLT